jgi:hypothetical protein
MTAVVVTHRTGAQIVTIAGGSSAFVAPRGAIIIMVAVAGVSLPPRGGSSENASS